MAGTSLLALIDDIASLLDDIGALTKTASSKTAGVLGDDLALNAEQLTGMRPERELPVVWAVAKGSALNKLILVPSALVLSAVTPWLVGPVLMAGGAYLCFEGFEKILHLVHPPAGADDHEAIKTLLKGEVDLVQFEQEKIKGAILTDLVLSAEIVVITLGSVQGEPLLTRALVMTVVAAGLTVGVYVFVAGIVKLDDLGLALARSGSAASRGVGRGILWFAPQLLRLLSIGGTCAMFLVGGGIWVHGIAPVARFAHGAEHIVGALPHTGLWLGSLVSMLLNAGLGLVVGALAVGLFKLVRRVRPSPA